MADSQFQPPLSPDDRTRNVTPADDTRAMSPQQAPAPMIPPPPQQNALPPIPAGRSQPPLPPQQRPPARRRPRKRSDNPMYLPLWSVVAMVVIVFVMAFGVIGLVIGLGGDGGPGGSPRIVIITAIPSSTPQPGQPTLPANAVTLEPAQIAPGSLPTFALEGPTLIPVILSPTPLSISLGATVVVNADSLNVRTGAGTDQDLVFMAPLGTTFRVIEGPLSATGFTWWRIQNPNNPSETGWAAAQFLDVQAPVSDLPATIAP